MGGQQAENGADETIKHEAPFGPAGRKEGR